LTNTAFAIVFNALLTLAIFLSVAGWYKRHPKYAVPNGFVGMMEMFVMNIENDVIRKSIGKDYARYSPYLLTAFFFILINNVMGLIPIFPGGANTTGNIAVTCILATCTMLAINVFGNKAYWKEIFWPDVPMWLKAPAPLMPLIEIVGVISKPFALMIRLFANITAGHAIVLSLTTLIFVTVKMGVATNVGMTFFSVLLSVFMNCLELLVAYIQAYVFTILSAVFIGLSRSEAHVKHKTTSE
jgi:F-type H+-transporting ATPase subunit a